MSDMHAMTPEELAARARAAGLDLTPAQLAEIYNGYRHVAAMAVRVRAGGRPREAEPAVIFKPGFGT
ncbi:MAG: hypothetical protein R3D44_11655 [Hyphomicrobiaceae bacterium]